MLGLSLPRVLAAQERAAKPARAKAVIFMMLFGGPSQLETFDLKPEAPEKIRGPFKPTACRTPELLICEHLPKLANVSDKFCVVRTMTHDFNDHSGGGHYMQTGRRWQIPIGGGFNQTPNDWPAIGSVVEYVSQREQGGLSRPMPSYAVTPNRLGRLEQQGQYIRPGEYAGWLGRAYNPLTTLVDKKDDKDNPYWRDCSDEELTFAIEGLAPARELTLDRLNRVRIRSLPRAGRGAGHLAPRPHRARYPPRAGRQPRPLWPPLVRPGDSHGAKARRGGSEVRDRSLRSLRRL
jgi:hypothetical protein